MKLRISLVDYLNSAPLGWAFLHGPLAGEVDVLLASPARCADQLGSGEADVGLIPSIEYQRIPGLTVVPRIAVAAVSRVKSVLLVRPKPVRAPRSVAIDTSSRTSVALVRLLLEKKLGLKPDLIPHPPVLEEMLSRCDAALLIGDAALRLSADALDLMDLAEEWLAWQQKPFVFAFWACRQGIPAGSNLVRMFQEAKAWGLEARGWIAEEYSRKVGLPEPMLREYLYRNIHYELGSSEVEGLQRFYQLLLEAGMISAVRPLVFQEDEQRIDCPARW